jgi:hypothetical protein
MGFFGETEKPFLLNIDPFSEYILLADFTDYFYNAIYDLYCILKYELNLSEKSYQSLNFEIFPVFMAVNSESQNSTSDESASDSELFRKKLKRYLAEKKVELIDPGFKWYPICRRNPVTDSSFRSEFFDRLKNFLLNHRDLLLPDDTVDLLLDQVVVKFDIDICSLIILTNFI